MTSISPAPNLNNERHRQQFPALTNKSYFNYGGQGPMPQAAMEAITRAQEHIQQLGPFSTEVNAWITQEAKATREAIATELGVPAQTITLTEDVTVGCNIALWGIDWQPGDHLLLSDCEHPGVVAIAQEIGRRFGVEVSTCPLMATLNDGNPAAVVVQHLRSTTRLVVLSHIFWNTGQVLPLAEIVKKCKQNEQSSPPVRVLVDAAQSVGLLDLNLTELGADFYAFTGHKWWCGPTGVGGLYVRPEARSSLKPTFIGFRGIVTDGEGTPVGWQPDGRRYEVSTSAFGQYAALRAAIATHQQWGTAKERYQQICYLGSYLWQRLTQLPQISCLRTAPPEAGLVCFQVTSSKREASTVHRQLMQFLEQKALMTRTLVNPDCVRACVHYFTLESEIDQLVTGIQEFCLLQDKSE